MAQTVTIFIVLALVFIILPVLLKRLTGKDFLQLLVGRSLAKKRRGGRDSGAKDGSGDDGTEDNRHREKNSSKNDILQTVSELTSFARRNQYYAIIPGMLAKGELETKLPVILVMRSGVVGINLFGYGGELSAKKDDPEWTQTMNGETVRIPSPIVVSEAARRNLSQIMREIGYGEIEVSVISAFTQKNVKITGPMASEVVRSRALTGELSKSRYVQSKDVDVKAVGEALSVWQVRAGGRKNR